MDEVVKYAASGDAHVAYREVVGDPSSDRVVLYCSGAFIPIEMMWADAGHARFLDGLAAVGRLIVFDRRGVGMSDPITDWSQSPFFHWVADAVAILDACEVQSADVVGWDQGDGVAAMLGLMHPDRVTSMTLIHGIDRLDRLGLSGSPEELAADVDDWVKGREPNERIAGLLQDDQYTGFESRRGDIGLLSWLDHAGRLGASPMTASSIYGALVTHPFETDLGELTCPTLLLWRRGNRMRSIEMGRAIAADYPSITFVELDGPDHVPFSGDIDGLVREIRRFVGAEGGATAPSERRLAVLLFTDIVASTQLAGEVGDDVWRGLLDEHDRIVRRVVDRHGGVVNNHTGDGVLALFDLASQALSAAGALNRELDSTGLFVRQGIHAGEIVNRRDEISGVAAHVAARIMNLAGPGEVLVSAVVPMLVEGAGFEFEPRAEVNLRGLQGERAIYELTA